MNSTKLIGLSLSFCVRDIVEGKVAYEQVTKLITGTCAPDDKEWELLMKDYLAWYWWGTEGAKIRPADERKAKAAIAIANRLRSEGKIEQPRHSTGMCPQWFHDGRWVRDESEIQWVKF
jgi:hypothetical protein